MTWTSSQEKTTLPCCFTPQIQFVLIHSLQLSLDGSLLIFSDNGTRLVLQFFSVCSKASHYYQKYPVTNCGMRWSYFQCGLIFLPSRYNIPLLKMYLSISCCVMQRWFSGAVVCTLRDHFFVKSARLRLETNDTPERGWSFWNLNTFNLWGQLNDQKAKPICWRDIRFS